MHLITRAFIMAGASAKGGWNRAQLETLGVSWPPRAKWISRIVGRGISDEAGEDFIALRGDGGKPRRAKGQKRNSTEPIRCQGYSLAELMIPPPPLRLESLPPPPRNRFASRQLSKRMADRRKGQ